MSVAITQRKGEPVQVVADEHPRGDTTLAMLAKLSTPFRKEGGTVTAGNSSGVNDGAAALVIASVAAIRRHGLTPLVRVVAGACVQWMAMKRAKPLSTSSPQPRPVRRKNAPTREMS